MENELRHLSFKNAIDPMWVIDIEGQDAYRFTDINETFTDITGWKREQVIGQPMENIIPASSHELVREKYSQVINTGKMVDYIEESQHPAGIKYGQIRVIPLKDDKGIVTKLLGIAHDITDKTMLEGALINERDRKNRQITAAAIKGQELERSRVSRELHDNVNQVLTTVKLYTELATDDKVNYKEVLPKCSELLVTTINEIRSLSKQLSAPSLGNLNYRETISELLESMRQASGMNIEMDMQLGDCMEMDAELHLTIYRVLQEQLTNIHKYANASLVNVSVQIENGVLSLVIKDNGVGFDTSKKYKGIGITNMQSRAQLLHGNFALESKQGKGTIVEIKFPVLLDNGICLPAYT